MKHFYLIPSQHRHIDPTNDSDEICQLHCPNYCASFAHNHRFRSSTCDGCGPSCGVRRGSQITAEGVGRSEINGWSFGRTGVWTIEWPGECEIRMKLLMYYIVPSTYDYSPPIFVAQYHCGRSHNLPPEMSNPDDLQPSRIRKRAAICYWLRSLEAWLKEKMCGETYKTKQIDVSDYKIPTVFSCRLDEK